MTSTSAKPHRKSRRMTRSFLIAPILRKIRAISVSRTARVFVDGGASIGISVIFGLSSLPDGYRFKRPVYRPFKMLCLWLLSELAVTRTTRCHFTGRRGRERRGSSRCMGLCVGYPPTYSSATAGLLTGPPGDGRLAERVERVVGWELLRHVVVVVLRHGLEPCRQRVEPG